jgi:DNA gyrase subunit B
MKVPTKYTTESLELLDSWSCIRHRPGMYIGSTGVQGMHQLAKVAVETTLEEFRQNHCSEVRVTVHSDGSLSVSDNGRAPSQATASHVLTHLGLHSPSGTQRSLLGQNFGLCGIGLECAAALSAWLVAEIRDGTHCWRARCVAPENIRPEGWEDAGACTAGETRFSVRFLPDPSIFRENVWDSRLLLYWLWERVHLYPGLTITFNDEREGCEPQVLCAPEGVRELLPWCLEGKTPVHENMIVGRGTHEGVSVDLALFFIEEDPTWRVYGCGIPLPDAGTPLVGLRTGLSRTLGKLASRTGISFQPHKARLGIAAIVSVWLENPTFGSPSKDRLHNPEAEAAVARATREALLAHARQHPAEIETILARI